MIWWKGDILKHFAATEAQTKKNEK